MIINSEHIIDNAAANPDISFRQTPNHYGPFPAGLPDTIVLHYTAGASYSSSADWLCNAASGASAHVIIGRKGEVVQLLPFNLMAWHAGTSSWKGRNNLNRYSIGIELANAGRLVKRANGYCTSFGQLIPDKQVVLATHKNEDSEAAWEAFTGEQLQMAETLCMVLKQQYGIGELVGHDDIAPGRKADPGPAFPLEQLRQKVLFGRHDETVADTPTPDSSKPTQGLVLADRLNIRSAPSANATTISEPLRKGTRFGVVEQRNGWLKVKVVTEGWIHRDYVQLVNY